MNALPTAPEALARSIELWHQNDRDGARYWLALASELRAGAVTAPADDAAAPESDTTAVLTLAGRLECKACGKELIHLNGDSVHRSTYRTECGSVSGAPYLIGGMPPRSLAPSS